MKRAAAQRWLAGAGIDLRRFQEDGRPRPPPALRRRHRGARRGNVALKPAYAKTENLAGMLPGKGPLADEVVVVGAHYDHLGYGGAGSMRPNEHAIHNGADDNASGTVAVLLAAERVKGRAGRRADSHRTVVVRALRGRGDGARRLVALRGRIRPCRSGRWWP